MRGGRGLWYGSVPVATTRETGLLLFTEDARATAARWTPEGVPAGSIGDLVGALHRDLLANLGRSERVAIYLTPAREDDAPYAAQLAQEAGVEVLQVPDAPGLRRWDSALSILYNGCGHRKVLCADARVPDFYAEDVSRAQSKLDLYEVVVGREAHDRCWLIGMNGYHEVLGGAEARANDFIHPLLEAAGRNGVRISVLDTKRALGPGVDLAQVAGLARGGRHPRLRTALENAGVVVQRGKAS